MNKLNKIYNHEDVEKNKYDFWSKEKIFINLNENKEPFSIIMPPPNITGKLHIGHSWDLTLQDLLIRYNKLLGKDTLYIPGMDHAGIATQIKVENILWNEKKITKYDLGKEKFLNEILKWKNKNSSIIRSQWKKMGLGINEDKEIFTLDENVKKIVKKIFVRMYNDNLIYRGKKVIFWDVKQKTALSNIEVNYKNVNGKMYYFKYFIENEKDIFLKVATTRPETMFGDKALVVNKKDKRYKKFINKKAINPVNNELLPIIEDDHVEIDYETGVMKCTPAHDMNDYIIGKKNNLEMPICIDKNGKMSELAGKYHKLDRFVARQQIVSDLKKSNILLEIKNYTHKVGFSERTNTIVEPYLSEQWFISMKSFANKIIKFQRGNNKINFFPKNFDKTLIKWMKDIQDWCISRQIWWGHRIPVWYNKTTKEILVTESDPINKKNWVQDEDVLDTWFSSAFWPFIALGWGNDKKMFNRYFPSNILVTGYDIIFFWVSRMIFQTLNITKNKPFNNVLIHGLIRDSKGKKMSKSLNNGIDPMDVIKSYGADTLRFFLLTNTTPGYDLKYNEEKVKFSWNFINKLWNASKYVINNLPNNYKYKLLNLNDDNSEINNWILFEYFQFKKIWFENMNKYQFSLAGKELINFIWNKYCSWYIELSKIDLSLKKNYKKTLDTLIYILLEILKMLHPFIPFVTEEIYQKIGSKKSILLDEYSNNENDYKIKNLDSINLLIKIIENIRNFRQEKNLTIKNYPLKLNLLIKNSKINLYKVNKYLDKIINCKILEIKKNYIKNNKNFLISCDNFIIEIINNEKLHYNINENLQKELLKLEKEILRCKKILQNKTFLQNAKKEVILKEQEKLKKYENNKKIILRKIVND